MSKKTKCGVCEHAEDLKGCASKHVAEARRLISQGKAEEVLARMGKRGLVKKRGSRK